MAVLAPDGDPLEAVEFSVLRRPLAEIGQSEADASVVREEPGVAFGHGRLGGLEVRVDESTRIRSLPRPSVLEFEGGAGQRGGELLEVGRDEVLGQARSSWSSTTSSCTSSAASAPSRRRVMLSSSMTQCSSGSSRAVKV